MCLVNSICTEAHDDVASHLQGVHANLAAVPSTSPARRKSLAALAAYIAVGRFPVNEHYPLERRPHFRDSAGTNCAVGHMMLDSIGMKAVELVNSKHGYDSVHEMRDTFETLDWDSGLTLEELALVQPTYDHPSFRIEREKRECQRRCMDRCDELRYDKSVWLTTSFFLCLAALVVAKLMLRNSSA